MNYWKKKICFIRKSFVEITLVVIEHMLVVSVNAA